MTGAMMKAPPRKLRYECTDCSWQPRDCGWSRWSHPWFSSVCPLADARFFRRRSLPRLVLLGLCFSVLPRDPYFGIDDRDAGEAKLRQSFVWGSSSCSSWRREPLTYSQSPTTRVIRRPSRATVSTSRSRSGRRRNVAPFCLTPKALGHLLLT
jgi:hypothetical protein